MRRKDNKYGYSSFTEEELRKYLKWLTIPGILIILVLVVILAKNLAGGSGTDSSQTSVQAEQPSGEGDLKEGQQEAVTAPAESGSEQSSQETSGETQAEQTEENFAKDGVPEINALMERYFTAKQNADIETIYQLFGRTDLEGAEALESQYRYTRQGGAEGSYLVYVSYDLKFKNVETLAPGLFRAYVITNEDGSLQLVDSSLQGEEVLQEFEAAEKTDELILLRTQIYAKLRQALETDPDLAGVYGVLQKNPAVGETQESKEGSSVSLMPQEDAQIEIEGTQAETESGE